MAEREVTRASASKPVLIQIVRPTAAMEPERQLVHLYTEINRVLALYSTQLESLKQRIKELEDK